MKTIDIKVGRDLIRMKAQILTIALVVASGIATFVSSLSTYDSLLEARDSFYRQSRFADAFAELRRAPLSLAENIAEIEGISAFELRIVQDSLLDIPGAQEPVVGRFISLPELRGAALNQVQLQSGRMPAPGALDEVLVSEAFARANRYRPGDSIAALFQGRYRRLRITGTAVSAEYIYAFRGTTPFPDDKHFGVFWTPRVALAAATDLDGAFNSISFLYTPSASSRTVLASVDRLLKPYGGVNAYDRADQISNVFIANEIEQNRIMAFVIPMIFLGVAAFLINVVITRLVQTQRGQIATLKAIGYPDRDVALHYAKLISVMIAPGALAGVLLGAWFGTLTTEMYGTYFHFPSLRFILSPVVVVSGVTISFVAALAGAGGVLFRVLRTPPAQAMQPPAPPRYRSGLLERLKIAPFLSVSVRLAFRNLANRPLRTGFSLLGISAALLIVLLGLFWGDTLNYLFYTHFALNSRDDATVNFRTALSERSLREIERYPGVLYAEGYRVLGVRLHAGHRSEDSAITGIDPGARLRVLRDRELRVISIPAGGLVLSSTLAEKLSVDTGDWLELEPLLATDQWKTQTAANSFEASRARPPDRNSTRIRLPVTGVAEELIGSGVYMEQSALRGLLGEGRAINQVAIHVDPAHATALYERLQNAPQVESVTTREASMRLFNETSAALILVMASIIVTFALCIAFAVVYNTARVSFSERAWELATLRILGFTKGEVFRVLAWELTLQTAPALLPGCVLGFFFVTALIQSMPVEGIRFPVIISVSSYAMAILVVVATGITSSLLIRRKVDRLNLVEVLKTRE
ncbi:MAG: FtsX-like permease family protein [bacterium]|nr:FtsX-like permease family protein [bacterium]